MKKVEDNGKKYKITRSSYGFSSSRLYVNEEGSSIILHNTDLEDIESFQTYAKRAIDEYEVRLTAKQVFNDWDGKL